MRRGTWPRRRNKFNAIPVHDMATGQSFDSQSEQRRYFELTVMEQAGEISDLQLHPKIVLVPRNGQAPEIAYRVDYLYMEKGRLVAEDWKPRPKTPRETLLLKLWKHFGPCLLAITGQRRGSQTVPPGVRPQSQEGGIGT